MWDRLVRGLASIAFNVEIRLRGVECDYFVSLRGKKPRVRNAGTMRFGPNLRIHGRVTAVQLATSASGTLTFGRDVGINEGTSIYAEREVTIGDNVFIGDYVSIADTNFHEVTPGSAVRIAPVVIGRNAWLARNVIVGAGITIGANAVIAAGSVVVKDVAANTLVGGNPARLIRELDILDPDTYIRPR